MKLSQEQEDYHTQQLRFYQMANGLMVCAYFFGSIWIVKSIYGLLF